MAEILDMPKYLEATSVEQLAPADLKDMIVDAALYGHLTVREAEDLISFYGLRHE